MVNKYLSWVNPVACIFFMTGAAAAEAAVGHERGVELIRMIRHDCGSCHGLTLKGGLGPPLLPGNLAGKDPDFLEKTITYGRPPQPMPPWQGLLSQEEIQWIVQRLIKGDF